MGQITDPLKARIEAFHVAQLKNHDWLLFEVSYSTTTCDYTFVSYSAYKRDYILRSLGMQTRYEIERFMDKQEPLCEGLKVV